MPGRTALDGFILHERVQRTRVHNETNQSTLLQMRRLFRDFLSLLQDNGHDAPVLARYNCRLEHIFSPLDGIDGNM